MTRSTMVAAFVAALFATGLGLGGAALGAGTPRDQQVLIGTLEQHSQRLADAARNTKGGPQQELLLRRARLRSLIDRLQKGEQIDPSEIDPLLR